MSKASADLIDHALAALTKERDQLRVALVGLLSDVLDHWDGNERDCDVVAEDIIAEFNLAAEVRAARTGATVDPS